jgi:hypothetical protein
MNHTTPTGTEAGIDLDKLEALAKSATQEQWKMIDQGGSWGLRVRNGYQGFFNMRRPNPTVDAEARANCAFIEAVSPPVALALIALARRAAPPQQAAALDDETLWDIHGVVKNAGSTSLAHKIADFIARRAAPDTTASASIADRAEQAAILGSENQCRDALLEIAEHSRAAQPVQAGEAVEAPDQFTARIMDKLDEYGMAVKDDNADWRSRARSEIFNAVYDRASLAPVSAPTGYKLVPLEPTPEMVKAAIKAAAEFRYNSAGMQGFTHADGYRAMVAAAPVSAQQGAAVAEFMGKECRAAKAPAAQAQPSTRAVLRKLVDIGKDRALTTAEAEHFQRMIEGMEAGRGLNVSDAPAAQAVDARGMPYYGYKLPLQRTTDKSDVVRICDATGDTIFDLNTHTQRSLSDVKGLAEERKGAEDFADFIVQAVNRGASPPEAAPEHVATVGAGKFANRLQWVSDEAMGSVPVGAKLYAATTAVAATTSEDGRDAARYRWIYDNCTTEGGGRGFVIECWVPVDEEDMGVGIDRAMRATQQEGGK